MATTFTNDNLCPVSYDDVRTAMGGKPFPMTVTGNDRKAVILAVNMRIDSHLEACNMPHRGDSYSEGWRMACSISPESLPVLLRRLMELEADDEIQDAAMSLAGSILDSLNFNENGTWAGPRED